MADIDDELLALVGEDSSEDESSISEASKAQTTQTHNKVSGKTGAKKPTGKRRKTASDSDEEGEAYA